MEKRTENPADEIKLIIASYTGEYEILTVVPKLGAQKVYDPNDYPELEPIMREFGSIVDSIWLVQPQSMMSGSRSIIWDTGLQKGSRMPVGMMK